MNESINPVAIVADLKRGNISKSLAIDRLVSLIEKSNNPDIRRQAIQALKKIDIPKDKNRETFRIIESCLLSDENQFVRSSAAELISHKFLKFGIKALLWTIHNDNSPYMLRTLIKVFLGEENDPPADIKSELIRWLKNYAKKMELIQDQVLFLLDVECLFSKYIKNYEISESSFRYFNILTEVPSENPFLHVNNKCVEGLNYNFYNWLFLKNNQDLISSFMGIKDLNQFLSLHKRYDLNFEFKLQLPSSIGLLSTLKSLNLSLNRLTKVPRFIFFLPKLQDLDLNKNNIKELPSSITKMKSLRKLNLKDNKIISLPPELKTFLSTLDEFRY
jgi:hypothetical protein